MALSHHLRHLFLPHHTNNFRAKVLHLDFFAVYVIVFFAISLFARTVQKVDPNILGFATNIHVQQLIELTNQKRASNGISSLTLNPQLSAAAAKKAEHMFTNGYWSHNAPDGTSPWDFINGSGYVYTVAGENLAKNFSDSEGVVEAWMNSPTHKENLLRGDYQDIGFAVVNGTLSGEETTLVVQMFGKRLTQIAQVKPTSKSATEFVTSAAAAEPPSVATSVAQLTASPSPLPSPEFLMGQVENRPIREVEIVPASQSVRKQPLIDIAALAKRVSLGLSSVLMLVLILDGYYIWRHKITRVGGKMIAHLFFLFVLSSTVWVMSFGSIL